MFKKLITPFEKPTALLWSQKEEFDARWKKRIEVMASYIDIPGIVADLGCGMMWLEPCLKEGNTYLPIDYIKRDERTFVVDLNKRPLPPLSASVGFLSGVLEYISDLRGFLDYLQESKLDKIILSYCTLENIPDLRMRKSLNWVNNESIYFLLSAFTRQYDLTAIEDVNQNTVMVFNRKAR
jgi:hypothetical protein